MNAFMTLGATDARDEQAWIEGWMSIRPHTALEALGAVFTEIDDDHATLTFEISDAARQPMGLLHGGVSLLVAETVASMHSAWLCDLKRFAPVGVDISGTHLRSATEGRVKAVGTVLRRTRTFVFHEVDILLEESGELLCKARVSNFLRPHG